MEIHPHSHVHHQKKWKDYLFQFFMLFLAVFLGFLAEYQLEQKFERNREKEYIHLLIEDLQTDTAILHNQLPLMRENIRGLDTLINQVYLYTEGKADTRIMYYTYHHYCRNRIDFELSQRTVNQLKNSGNMRLIRDSNATNILANMEINFEQLKEQTDFYRIRQEDASNFGMKIFDFREYQKANIKEDGTLNPNDDGFLSLAYSPPLNLTDPKYLKEFAARLGYYRNYLSGFFGRLERAIPYIEVAINTLKKDYHIVLDDKQVVKKI